MYRRQIDCCDQEFPFTYQSVTKVVAAWGIMSSLLIVVTSPFVAMIVIPYGLYGNGIESYLIPGLFIFLAMTLVNYAMNVVLLMGAIDENRAQVEGWINYKIVSLIISAIITGILLFVGYTVSLGALVFLAIEMWSLGVVGKYRYQL